MHQGWERTDPDAIRAEIEEMATRLPGEPGGWVQFTVEERSTDRLVGDVGISPDTDDMGVMKIGYTIDPAFQGRGYATEAIRALVAYAIDKLEAGIVRAYAEARNTPSIRVMEKAGLSHVETSDYVDNDGTWKVVRYERRADAAS
jgi:aminoglycoside 6'-N-acetyltransferase